MASDCPPFADQAEASAQALSVLVISPRPSVPGGVSTFIECLKRHLTRSRATSFWIGSSTCEPVTRGAVMKRLIAAPWKIARLVRRKNFDLVHINPSFDAKSLIRDGLILLALRATGYKRVLFYIHGWDGGVQERIKNNPALRNLVGWILNQAAALTVLGESFRRGLIELGVDADRIILTRTMFEGGKPPQAQPAPAARRTIVFMSRFDREKGVHELLQGFAALEKDFPDLDLVMAGEGDEAEALKAQTRTLGLSQRVFFPGYVGGVEKARLLHACAIYALPTFYRSEGMPVAMLEAMGAGKPLLVGSAGAIRSVVSEPDNGIVLSRVTAQSVEQGLRRLLTDPSLASAGARNAALAWSAFEARIVTAEVESIYQRVARC